MNQIRLINMMLNVNGWYIFGRGNKPTHIGKFCKITPTGYNFLTVVSDNCFKSVLSNLLYENPRSKKSPNATYKNFILSEELTSKIHLREICEQGVKNIGWQYTTDENIQDWKIMWDNLIKINDSGDYKFCKIINRLYKMEDKFIEKQKEMLVTNPIMQLELM